jgi:vacuolar-type H+-ATPase subunit H
MYQDAGTTGSVDHATRSGLPGAAHSSDTEVLLRCGDVDGVTVLPALPPAQRAAPTPAPTPAAAAAEETMVLPDGALQVLTLAQRTADDHIAAANQHVHRMRAEAQALAGQIQRDAHSYAEQRRAEADKFLADARAEAERIVADGNDYAELLKLRAQQRYQDAVGGLSIKRESLQKQIEALATFDNEYRQRITSFLQSQLRALWADQPDSVDSVDSPAMGALGPGRPADPPGHH